MRTGRIERRVVVWRWLHCAPFLACLVTACAPSTTAGSGDAAPRDVVAADAMDAARQTCTTSRQCPGQVCATALGYCVDCNDDPDCPSGQRCQDYRCVDPPRACTSSRQCSELGLVCDTSRGVCVECVTPADCTSEGETCSAANRCVPRLCIASDVRCVEGVRQTCDAYGTDFVAMPCAAQQSCVDGACVDRLCQPGTRRCVSGDATRMEVCDDAGIAFVVSPCPTGQLCSEGACLAPTCMPGAYVCADANTRRVCNSDGRSYTAAPCAAMQSCVGGGECRDRVCMPGSIGTTCSSETAQQVCSPDGQGYSTTPCPMDERCMAGRCMRTCGDEGQSPCAGGICNAGTVDVMGVCRRCTAAVQSIAPGDSSTCVLLADGTVRCWGRNQVGQLGNGTTSTTDSAQPTTVVGLTEVVQLVGGQSGYCARRRDGTLWCWGSNSAGRLGDGTSLSRSAPVRVMGLPGAATDVAMGSAFTCAVVQGSAYCWGSNGVGQLGDGTLNGRMTPAAVVGLPMGVVAVGAGNAQACVLLSTGGVRCWGDSPLGNGSTSSSRTPVQVSGLTGGVAQLSVGRTHACVRMEAGTLRCWGVNGGELGDGTTDGRPEPVPVLDIVNAIDIRCGFNQTCALLTDRSMRCWGVNQYGSVGDGTTSRRTRPVEVMNLREIRVPGTSSSVSSSWCAVRMDGSVWCWGLNHAYQLGDGTITNQSRPVRVTVLGDSGC